MGSLPAGRWPPFSGESGACISFAIVSVPVFSSVLCALETVPAETAPPQHPLYTGGAGPLQGITEQQLGLSPHSGNLGPDKFSLSTKYILSSKRARRKGRMKY